MGDTKRKHKKFSRPKKAFDKIRIEEENVLRQKYGLKSKREIWKAERSIKVIRDNAKALITADEKDKSAFLERLKSKGFMVEKIEDVLRLNKEAFLKRRLQTIIIDKQLARSPKHARQLIVHKHVAINGKKVNIPSYLVPVSEESEITLVLKPVKIKEDKNNE